MACAREHIEGGGILELVAAVVEDRDVTRGGGRIKPDRFGLVLRVASLIKTRKTRQCFLWHSPYVRGSGSDGQRHRRE